MTPWSNFKPMIELPVTYGEVTWPIGLLYDLVAQLIQNIFKYYYRFVLLYKYFNININRNQGINMHNDYYKKHTAIRRQYELPLRLQQFLAFQEDAIKKDTTKNSSTFSCYTGSSSKRYEVDPDFSNAFCTLSVQQKQEYYVTCVSHIKNQLSNIHVPDDSPLQNKNFNVFIRGGTFNSSWIPHIVMIDAQKLTAGISKKETIDLRNYLCRRSHNKDKYAFVLEPSTSKVDKPYRIGFNEYSEFLTCFDYVLKLINKHTRNLISAQLKELIRKSAQTIRSIPETPKIQIKKEDKTTSLIKQSHKEMISQIKPPKLTDNAQLNKTISAYFANQHSQQNSNIQQQIEQENNLVDILHDHDQQSFDQEMQKIIAKKNLDIFHNILPDYDLSALDNDDRFFVLENEFNTKYQILEHNSNSSRIKFSITIAHQMTRVLSALLDITKYKLWNQQVNMGNIELRIKSENSQIVYMKHKAYNQFYRERDFVFLRHLFNDYTWTYIVDKSLENDSYVLPFSRIERAQIKYTIWGLRRIDHHKTYLLLETQIDHKGYLTKEQNKNLTLRYVKELSKLQLYLTKHEHQAAHIDFDIGWDINNNKNNKFHTQMKSANRSQVQLFNKHLCSQIEEDYYTANEEQDWDGDFELENINTLVFKEEEVERKQILTIDEHILPHIDCELDSEGYAILPKEYIKKRHHLYPVKVTHQTMYGKKDWKHYLWQNLWEVIPEGQIKCIDLEKLKEQSGVFTHILKSLGRNLLAGKSILNISLPVQIFSQLSVLQLTARALSLSSKVLEKAANSDEALQRFKQCMVFGLSNSLLYLEMEKPFNPILGQTYQGWINGCPVACQQISHHPPISAFYLQGRGYKLYGNIEAKINLSLNSGVGLNDGVYNIEFEKYKDSKVCFRSPGGEIKGLVTGDRLFLFNGKGIFWDQQNRIFCELIFNPTKKGFMSFGAQQKPSDYMQGTIYRVTEDFLKKVKEQREPPSKKQIVEVLGKCTGRWTESLIFDNKVYYNINTDVPHMLEQQKYPLNSNANYRQDIIYRRRKDYARARIEKERLENVQRNDRKLRAAKGGKGH